MIKKLYYRLERVPDLEAVQAAERSISSYPKKCKDMDGKEQIQKVEVFVCGDSETSKTIHQLQEIQEVMQGNHNNSKLL